MFVTWRTADEARSLDTRRRDVFSTEFFDSTRYLDGALRVAHRGTNTFELTLAQSVSSTASKPNGNMGSSSDNNADDEPSSGLTDFTC